MKPYSEKSTVELKGWLTLYIFVLSVFLFCSILMFIYGIQKFKHEHYIMAVSAIVVGVVQLKIVSICFLRIQGIYGKLKVQEKR